MPILTNSAVAGHCPRTAIVSIRNLAAAALLVFSGCSLVVEPYRFVQGTPLRPLEKARKNALRMVVPMGMDEAIDWLISAAEEQSLKVSTVSRNKRVVVVTGVPGSIDTTTVGIFVQRSDENEGTVLEIASWSEFARRAVWDLVTKSLAASGDEEGESTTQE